MHSLFRRPQAVRGHTRQHLTWEERTRAALAAAREVEENSGESVPTRPSEVNAARRLCYGPRYMLPGAHLNREQQQQQRQREEECQVLQANMSLDISSLQLFSLMMESNSGPDAVAPSPYYTLSFIVNTLVPLSVNLHWLATEEWDMADDAASPYPRFVSRGGFSRSYLLDAGYGQRFTLPRSDWLEPSQEPYRTLISSDWQQARSTAPLRHAESLPLISAMPATTNQTLAPADVGSEAIEMGILHCQQQPLDGVHAHTSEIEEVPDDTYKAPIYGLVIELVDSRKHAGSGPCSQIAFIDFYRDGPTHLVPRCIKQKVCIDGMLFQQHEIFGLSEAMDSRNSTGKEDPMQCAICLSDDRDTVMLPCRHLCMCRECANTYRQQSNKCPICRTVVETILHIRSDKSDQECFLE
ncbi:hypothetical protein H4R22_002225 [Coemansia sp. RSA 1290]|nr:hypothetical protein H4R22_002225 [Coemansia sp. RSA 1290]KAJ2648653.1 hypothetical protein IWW40_003717 [Coemansia sp. RSA 1250]